MIYFIQSGKTGPVKIGKSIAPEKRLRQFQTHSVEQLYLLQVIPGDLALERKLHHQFEALHIRGEWFNPGPELLAYIDSLTPKGWYKWNGKTQSFISEEPTRPIANRIDRTGIDDIDVAPVARVPYLIYYSWALDDTALEEFILAAILKHPEVYSILKGQQIAVADFGDIDRAEIFYSLEKAVKDDYDLCPAGFLDGLVPTFPLSVNLQEYCANLVAIPIYSPRPINEVVTWALQTLRSRRSEQKHYPPIPYNDHEAT